MEHDCTIDALTSKQRKRFYISLQQQHIPTLETRVVDYDPDRQEVTPTKTPARIWRAFSAFEEALDG